MLSSAQIKQFRNIMFLCLLSALRCGFRGLPKFLHGERFAWAWLDLLKEMRIMSRGRPVVRKVVCERSVIRTLLCGRSVLRKLLCNRSVFRKLLCGRSVIRMLPCGRYVVQTLLCDQSVARRSPLDVLVEAESTFRTHICVEGMSTVLLKDLLHMLLWPGSLQASRCKCDV